MNEGTTIYALNLDLNTQRILSVTLDKYGAPGQPRVTEFPQDNIANYLYINGEFIYDPLPEPEQPAPQPNRVEILENKVEELQTQNNMFLECLLELSEEVYN